MHPFFLDKLQDFRSFLDREFLVNHGSLRLRGWRSLRENEKIGGKLFHPFGVAADITVIGMDSEAVFRAAKEFGFHGVGLYDTFVHVDMRPRLNDEVVTWDYRRR